MGYLQNKALIAKNESLQRQFSTAKTNNAIGMYSGGLDSILAALLIKDQGYNIHLVHFVSPFFGKDKDGIQEMKTFVENLGMNFIEYPMPESYITEVLHNPKYGYGKSINPCIDCHSYMFRLATKLMIEIPADFVFTGEVIGQRPMSQNKIALHIVETMSGLGDRLLRPLSAKLLKETYPEKQAWLNRTRLLDISGRGRKKQEALAKKYRIKEYPQPAGGCHLTDHALKPRFNTLKKLVSLNTWEILGLLKIGRHFVFNEQGVYMIIARDAKESSILNSKRHYLKTVKLEPINTQGAIALLFGKLAQFTKNSDVLRVFARYTRAYRTKMDLDIRLVDRDNSNIVEGVLAFNDESIERYRVR